jgi:hypothetical protein
MFLLQSIKRISSLVLSYSVLLSFLPTLQVQAEANPAWNSQSVWEELIERDHAVRQGSISYNQSLDQEGPKLHHLSYLRNLRFKKIQPVAASSTTPAFVSELMYDGEDYFTSLPEQITISAGAPTLLQPVRALVDVTPRPCIPTGRGLSILTNHSIEISGSWATVTGTGPDGTTIVAKVDLSDHLLIRKMVRYGSDRIKLGEITTKGSTPDGSIAKASEYRFMSHVRKWEFLKADFQAPPASTFKPFFPEEKLILDQRLGTPIGIQKTTFGRLNKGQILRVTQRETRKLEQKNRLVKIKPKIQAALNTLMILLPLFLLGLWISLKRNNAN